MGIPFGSSHSRECVPRAYAGIEFARYIMWENEHCRAGMQRGGGKCDCLSGSISLGAFIRKTSGGYVVCGWLLPLVDRQSPELHLEGALLVWWCLSCR